MLCEKGLGVSSKSIDSSQPPHPVQADMGRNFSLSLYLVSFKGTILYLNRVGCLLKLDFMDP